VPLSKALKEMSSKYGVSVVFDPKAVKSKAVENPVTLTVDDVPFEAAVRLMCEMAELKPARMGNVIYVTTEARADKLKDSDSLVPNPSMFNPGVPGGLFGGFAGFGGAVPGPAIGLPAPVVERAVPDKAEPAKEEKKEEPPERTHHVVIVHPSRLEPPDVWRLAETKPIPDRAAPATTPQFRCDVLSQRGKVGILRSVLSDFNLAASAETAHFLVGFFQRSRGRVVTLTVAWP
jgi:hypothetical protein